ncbi:MAG: CoA-binding protein [Pseudomonadota bacterium]|nr:CoA-binding protein [Pseudomonadota bacterium]
MPTASHDTKYHLNPRGIEAFKHYYVGLESLEQIATREDRICVLNILGSESRTVTPISHVYSGGNVVCGTMPGRSGAVQKTEIGDIPVYNNVAEALGAGHRFNVAVVYVPPAGVKDSVIEAVRVNPEINKVVILTEKVPLADARIIRQYCQHQGVDVFGANCLGIADAHHHVRIGGALGGNAPEESLVPGSVAIFSNSGNFTTTIATYLLTGGWGTTVSLSSGKDVYIHFSAPEFVHALHNDPRSKAAVMYIEPGGYYERDLEIEKPVVACVVGRWKAMLTRACGHAGAIAGAGDNAAEKEKWFMEKFGVTGLYTPEHPVCSEKGAVVTNIAYIPEAMSAVMRLNGVGPDFEPQGDLSLKCWFASDDKLNLPEELDLPVVEAIPPYNRQIAHLAEQIGVVFPRQSMKDASGASMMDPKTQVSRLHDVSVLDMATKSFESNLMLALLREYPDKNGRALANVALNAFVNQHGTPMLAAADAARAAGNSPNTVLSAALAIMGPKSMSISRKAVQALLELFRQARLFDPEDDSFDFGPQLEAALTGPARDILLSEGRTERGTRMLAAVRARSTKSVFVSFLEALAERGGKQIRGQVVLAAISCHLVWIPIMNKRLSLTTLENLPWHFRIFSALVGATVSGERQEQGSFCGVDNGELMSEWSFAETAHLGLIGNRPDEGALFTFSILMGLVATNGPGTISAQGTKGAVSADGPEVPERVQINKAYIGFLTHTGYAHGGNGFEAMSFLLDQFRNVGLDNPGNADHGLDLSAMALDYARSYKDYKTNAKAEGNLSYTKIPCINHPVFKGKDVNYDPREVYVRDLIKKRGAYNIFLEFYHELVDVLCKIGVSRNVYCVNVDAVIAVILLRKLWEPFVAGQISEEALEYAAFTVFVFGRMIGSAAEIEDHINRGRNMDTRTPASQCRFVG